MKNGWKDDYHQLDASSLARKTISMAAAKICPWKSLMASVITAVMKKKKHTPLGIATGAKGGTIEEEDENLTDISLPQMMLNITW